MILLPHQLRESPHIVGGFTWKRDVPDDWQRQLAELSPRVQSLSWLKLVWVAGSPDDPIQRWVIFQMSQREKIPEFVLSMLQGPPPHPVTNPVDLMREQWDLYRETGCWGQPFWIIQGEHGGHKRHFNRIEQLTCRMHKRPIHPPVAGALPYAPFNERVIQKIAVLDRAQFWERGIRFCEGEEWKAAALTEEENAAALSELQGRLWDWLESQADEALDSVMTLQNADTLLSDIPTSPDVPYLDRDEVRKDFTEMGEV